MRQTGAQLTWDDRRPARPAVRGSHHPHRISTAVRNRRAAEVNGILIRRIDLDDVVVPALELAHVRSSGLSPGGPAVGRNPNPKIRRRGGPSVGDGSINRTVR